MKILFRNGLNLLPKNTSRRKIHTKRQVDEWNQSRKEKIQSELFLTQLNLDIESGISSIKDAIEGLEDHIANGRATNKIKSLLN